VQSTLRIASLACALAVALSAAGCKTTGRHKPAANVRTTDASYNAGQELPPDIKQILMAGGLNADNPSAPARPPLALASADLGTEPAEGVVQVAARPPSRQILMAARGLGPSQSVASLAADPGSVAPRLPEILLATAAKPGRANSVAVAAAKPAAKARGPVRMAAAAKTPLPPSKPSARKPDDVPETQGSPIRFASIDAGSDRAGSKGAKADRASEVVTKKAVRRF